MRIYINWQECYNEIKRDLKEMGVVNTTKSMQDKKGEFETLELQNYSYTLLNANSKMITGTIQPWADEEFRERIHPSGNINPGEAYKLRKEVWNDFLHNGKMAYTYNERIMFNNQLNKIIERLKEDKTSRQLWLSIWNTAIDIDKLGGISRVPCSLGYNFQFRDNKLNMNYIMRSCDFATHFTNDVYLAIKLLEYVAKEVGVEVGSFTHTIFSLHIYKKDVKGVF